MITFLVLNIIMTILTAVASIIVTIAVGVWNTAVSASDCITVGDSCVCANNETYDGTILFLKIHEICASVLD